MTADITQAAPDAARRLTDRIKAGLDLMWELVAEAYVTRAWSALGYATWDEYCTREFGTARLSLPREERAETVASLKSAGLSYRAIASATGQSLGKVQRQLGGVSNSRQSDTPGQRSVNTGDGQLGIDGKIYPLRPPAPEPEPSPDEPWQCGQCGGYEYEDGGDGMPDQCHCGEESYALPDAPPKPAPVMLTLRTHDGREVPYPQPRSAATFNQTDGDGISWAKWSWNPVTGCLHGCDYCYARAIASRWTDAYPAGFTPLFHHERLDAPANTTIPAAHADDPEWLRVFVCSMADLYGRWVPDEWIKQVHESMLASPQWQYILLTKFPDRYPGLEMPPGAWVGTSVDEQKRVRIAERAFREIDGAAVKWLSLEPLREPLEFTDLSMFDWVVIGAQTETQQPGGPVPAIKPHYDWVQRITEQAREAGCRVHHKPNLTNGKPGMQMLNEYPGEG